MEPSYKPGVHLTDLSESLPSYAMAAIREALQEFDKQIKGFAMYDALLTGDKQPPPPLFALSGMRMIFKALPRRGFILLVKGQDTPGGFYGRH